MKRAAVGARLGAVLKKLFGHRSGGLQNKVRFGDDIAEALGGATKMDDIQKGRVFQSLFDGGPGKSQSAVQSFASNVGKMAPFAIGAMAVPAVDAAVNKHKQGNSFEHMLEVYPDLKKHDASDVEKAFSVVSTYAPSIAKDPVAAGAAVSKFVQFDTIDPAHLKQLLEIEGKQRQTQPTFAAQVGGMLQAGMMGDGA